MQFTYNAKGGHSFEVEIEEHESGTSLSIYATSGLEIVSDTHPKLYNEISSWVRKQLSSMPNDGNDGDDGAA